MANKLYFTETIAENIWNKVFLRDKEVLAYYDKCLKEVDSRLTIETRLSELIEIFSVIKWWDEIKSERLKYAPSKDVASRLFKEDLLNIIAYDEHPGINAEVNENKSLNRYRKIAYRHYEKGENLKLGAFGYLILKCVYENTNNGKIFKEVSRSIDIVNIVRSLGEGAALVQYLNSELHKQPGEDNQWKDLIKTELQIRLEEQIESQIQNKIAYWKRREHLIECAAFCQLLFEFKYFNDTHKDTSRKSVNDFSLSKYGVDIANQLLSSQNKAREVHKKILTRLFSRS